MTPLARSHPQGATANFLIAAPPSRLSGFRPTAYSRSTAGIGKVPISATILTKNSQRMLPEVLAALQWCDEVVILDTGSTDGTMALAASFSNVSLHQLKGPFPGFGRAHRQTVELARNDWIFSVDSDEIVSPKLRDEIATLGFDPETVYVIPFENYFNGKHITTCGWSPDRHARLFNRTATNFCESEVHERVQAANLTLTRLWHPMRHYSYGSLDDFLRKMASYAHLFASQNAGKKRSSPRKATARAVWAFFKSYVLERGFLQGGEGLVISAYKSQVVFWKYLLLHEANQRGTGRNNRHQ